MTADRKQLITAAAVTTGTAALGISLLLQSRLLNWGATPADVTRRLPGDDLLPKAGIVSTRAIAITAPPDAIWPWLEQMGSGRGGAYTYDWIENLFGLGMRSADRILPQFQNLKVGDEIPLGPDRPMMRVEILDPERVLTVRSADGNWVWIFAIFPEGRATRLISRNRIATPSTLARLFYLGVMVPGSLVMERKMLTGIRDRAERLARQPGPVATGAGPSW
jgi:hypothetical protein